MPASMLVTPATVCLLVLSLASSSVAGAVYVDVAGGGDFTTIQEGLDAAGEGDTVRVAQGTYSGPFNRNLDPGLKNIVVVSDDGSLLTIVDCDGLGRGFHIHGGQSGSTVIRGFTVTGGSLTGYGAGVCCEAGSSPTISECVFTDNEALGDWPDGAGGGMYLGEACDATVSSCTFTENRAVFGAGMLVVLSAPQIMLCDFSGNVASEGGGGAASVSGYPDFAECRFEGNWGVFGSGMACDGGSPHMSDVSFLANEAQFYGGGVSTHNSAPELERCLFQGNSAGSGGGAIHAECWPVRAAMRDGPAPAMVDCVLVGNAAGNGGAVHTRWGAVPALSGCTLYANSASAGGAGVIFCYQTSATVTECIIANSVEGAAISCSDPGAVPYVRRCVIFANEGGDVPCGDVADILFQDPLFCDAAGGDLGLCADSPCLPGGNPWGTLIGAYGKACGPCTTAVQSTTWGAIKTMFR